MSKKLTKAAQKARAGVLAKVALEDFNSMSQSAYSDWINALPVPEFIALLDLHGEMLSRERNPAEPEQEPKYVAPYTADDPFGTWVDCTEQPVPDETVVWVTYDDGSVGGPNRAGSFLWDGTTIIAYAVARNPKPTGA